jgi:lysozyme family protein
MQVFLEVWKGSTITGSQIWRVDWTLYQLEASFSFSKQLKGIPKEISSDYVFSNIKYYYVKE